MTAISASAATSFLSLLLIASALPAQTTEAAPQSSGVSKVRIVRLSEVKGAVQVDRNNGQGFEAAMTNLPVVEQSRIRTDVGVAEIEFEDNSTLRLAPDTVVEFPQLERMASGGTISSVKLLRGTVYASLVKTRGNEFSVLFGQEKLELAPASHVRLEMNATEAKLAVLDGTVHVDGAPGSLDVPKKKTVTFNLVEQSQPAVTKNIAEESFDSWDQKSAQYHARVATMTALNSSPYSYGLNDMAYYGSFSDAGGCGMMWQPYFVSANWSPYSNGAWAWYQGAGYSWVSPYPWGWTPYHYGSWSYCQGAGWGWMPGGGWNGLNNIATIPAGGGRGILLHPPNRPPRPGEPTLTMVNQKPLVASTLEGRDSFVFRKDSAGFGIPRESLGNLNKFSHSAIEHGTASTHIYLEASPAVGNTRFGGQGISSVSMHRGSAPTTTSMSGRSGLSEGSHMSAGTSSSNVSSTSMSSASSHAGGGGGGGAHGH